MRKFWRIAGLLLLTLVVAALASTPALALACSHVDSRAGHFSSCHRHRPLDRQPANHMCCAAGRDVAIPVSAFSGLQLSSPHPHRLHEIAGASDTAGCLSCFAESPSPPSAALLFSPLRI